MALPKNFRKLSIVERRRSVQDSFHMDDEEMEATRCGDHLLELSDIMVESTVGCMPVPLGIASGFLIDDIEVAIPLAVEEPSVVAAASYAAVIVKKGGGFRTWATDPVMSAQIFLENVPEGEEISILSHRREIEEELNRYLASLRERGGGFRGLEVIRLASSSLVRIDLKIDVQDAMGANILNSAAEKIRGTVEALIRGKTLMCILSNAAVERRAGARFSLPVGKLHALAKSDMTAQEIARRVVLASELASEDETRAVTHNKGIMNGISSLALATGNDTRAVEAAAHAWAARNGHYKSVSLYQLNGETLEGRLELPLPLASVGGAVSVHPASRFSLRVLNNPDAKRLSRIAAALGLAQNFAALLALVTGGIQEGHMRFYAERRAYQAGARREEIRAVAEGLRKKQSYSVKDAKDLLSLLRKTTPEE